VLVYQQLSFPEGPTAVRANVLDRVATASIPTDRTTQPGIKYHWEFRVSSRLHVTPEAYIPFIDDEAEQADADITITAAGDAVAWDIERASGVLPNGRSIVSGSARLPHNRTEAVTSKYMELRAVTNSEVHKGVDFGVPSGTPIYAMADGYVHNVVNESPAPTTGWGNYVMLRHGNDDYYSHYAHLTSAAVQKNSQVSKGQLLGYSGNTGNSSGPHLDTGFDCYVSGVRLILYPFRWFLTSASPYANDAFRISTLTLDTRCSLP